MSIHLKGAGHTGGIFMMYLMQKIKKCENQFEYLQKNRVSM